MKLFLPIENKADCSSHVSDCVLRSLDRNTGSENLCSTSENLLNWLVFSLAKEPRSSCVANTVLNTGDPTLDRNSPCLWDGHRHRSSAEKESVCFIVEWYNKLYATIGDNFHREVLSRPFPLGKNTVLLKWSETSFLI